MKTWDANVRAAAREAIGTAASPPFVNKALDVLICFRLRRPADHWSAKGGLKPCAVHEQPRFKPDLSKLVRQTEDALSGIIYDDDARICRLYVEKVIRRARD